MLAAMTDVEGSAGYVAMERVAGKLDGREGTFALQHSGTMTRGTPHLVITVVPDSGTGQLAQGWPARCRSTSPTGSTLTSSEYTLAQPK